jgi:hypothetical protein
MARPGEGNFERAAGGSPPAAIELRENKGRENPKSEIRNPKEARNPKSENYGVR